MKKLIRKLLKFSSKKTSRIVWSGSISGSYMIPNSRIGYTCWEHSYEF